MREILDIATMYHNRLHELQQKNQSNNQLTNSLLRLHNVQPSDDPKKTEADLTAVKEHATQELRNLIHRKWSQGEISADTKNDYLTILRKITQEDNN